MVLLRLYSNTKILEKNYGDEGILIVDEDIL